MVTHNDISCAIQVDGSTLQEYVGESDDQSQSPATKTVYVEAQESATFSIQFVVSPDYKPSTAHTYLSFQVYVGGQRCSNSCIFVGEGGRRRTLVLEGPISVDNKGNKFVHPFQFAGVSLVEDHESSTHTDLGLLEKMGEISIYVLRARWDHICPRKPQAVAELPSAGEVSEKALKGKDLTHVVKLGTPKLADYQDEGIYVCYMEGDSIQTPFTHLRFRYRSKGALQNLGLIPFEFPPSPVQARPQSSTARERALKQEVTRLRAELESKGKKSRVKREVEGEDRRPSKRVRVLGTNREIETIDLTGDD